MRNSLIDLADDLENFAKQVPEISNDAAKTVASEILTDLAKHTPVDITTAVSNWTVTFQKPTDPLFPTKNVPKPLREAHFVGESGSTAPSSRAMTVQEGISSLQKKSPGVKIYLSNLSHYIGKLNAGSSFQEPAGFVERAVEKGLTVDIDKKHTWNDALT